MSINQIHADDDGPERKNRSQFIQDTLLRAVLLAMLCASGYVLFQDYQLLEREAASNRYADILDPVPMQPVVPRDQLRPYLPSTRPIGPGKEPPNLQPYNLPEDATLRDAMTFRMGTDGQMLAHGTITPGTAEVMRDALLGREASLTEIVLHSPGGSVRDALELARLIREKDLNTRVVSHGYCASSCPLVLSGGVDRVAEENAWIGVHQVYPAASNLGDLATGMDQAQRITAEAQELLEEMGVDSTLWIKAMETPKDQLYVLTAEELTLYRLANFEDTVVEGEGV